MSKIMLYKTLCKIVPGIRKLSMIFIQTNECRQSGNGAEENYMIMAKQFEQITHMKIN